MKKFFFFLGLALLTGLTTSAQEITFGARAGITGSNIKAKASGISMSLDTKIGFYVGAFAEIGVAEDFAIEPQLYFSQMGAKVNLNFEGDTFSGSSESGYLNLPILAKYKNSGFSVFAGPQIGFLLYAKDKSEGESLNTKDEYESIDISAVAGVGYTFPSGLGIDARYQFGLTNVAKEVGDQASVKNNGFAVGLHYFFNQY